MRYVFFVSQALPVEAGHQHRYFLVLRVGGIHDYDYAGNLTQGMGDLRAFIKQKESKVSGKLNKKVDCFSLVPELNLELMIEQYKRGEVVNFEP